MLGHATNTIRHPNDWITSKFMKNFDANPSGRFTFGELIAEYDSIITAIRADTMKDVVGQPEWLTASKKMPKKVRVAEVVACVWKPRFYASLTNQLTN